VYAEAINSFLEGEAMTIPEILQQLDRYTGRFPMEAMRAAIEQREAITPELLRALEAVAENPEEHARREDRMLHLFALYLLAQFREKRAFPFVVKMFSAPGETPFDLAGDTVTERLEGILASIYDGNPAPLQELVENEAANEYVRNAAIRSFVVLGHSGQMPREQVVEYFRTLFRDKLPRTFSYVWTGLARSVAELPAPELLEDVRQVYQAGLLEISQRDFEHIERELRSGELRRRGKYTLITNAISEMEWWACFKQPGRLSSKSKPGSQPAASAGATPPPPKVHKKPWRNAPCPCGSGKKYKHCCGKPGASAVQLKPTL
jgi:hypothetical protein